MSRLRQQNEVAAADGGGENDSGRSASLSADTSLLTRNAQLLWQSRCRVQRSHADVVASARRQTLASGVTANDADPAFSR